MLFYSFLQKAFDTIDYETLLKKLLLHGIRRRKNNWFCSFLIIENYVSKAGVYSDIKLVCCVVL